MLITPYCHKLKLLHDVKVLYWSCVKVDCTGNRMIIMNKADYVTWKGVLLCLSRGNMSQVTTHQLWSQDHNKVLVFGMRQKCSAIKYAGESTELLSSLDTPVIEAEHCNIFSQSEFVNFMLWLFIIMVLLIIFTCQSLWEQEIVRWIVTAAIGILTGLVSCWNVYNYQTSNPA